MVSIARSFAISRTRISRILASCLGIAAKCYALSPNLATAPLQYFQSQPRPYHVMTRTDASSPSCFAISSARLPSRSGSIRKTCGRSSAPITGVARISLPRPVASLPSTWVMVCWPILVIYDGPPASALTLRDVLRSSLMYRFAATIPKTR